MVDLAKLELRVQSLEVQKADARLKKLEVSATKAGKGADRFNKSARRAAGGAAALSKGAAGLLRTMGPLIALFSGIAIIRGTVRAIGSFEEALAQVQGIAIKTTTSLAKQGQQFELLRNQALKLGATTRFTATEAGEAQLFLARAGFEVNEIFSALPGTLDLAAAGVLDLGTAADIASNVLNQFRLEADEMNRVGDILINTANNANTNVLQLSEALKLAGPVAKALGLDLEITAASLGTLGDAGIQASLAGTQFRGILGALASPTRKAEKIIGQLADRLDVASDFFDITKESADGITPPLFRVLKAFRDSGASASDFFKIFGRRQAAGAIVLSGFADSAENLAESNRNAENEARRLALIMEDTLPGAFRSLKSAVEGAALAIGKAGFGGALRSSVDFMVLVVRALAGIGEEFDKLPLSVRIVTNAIKGLAAASAVFVAIKFAASIAAAGTALLAFATGPVGLVIVAIGTLIFLFTQFKDRLITIGDTSFTVGELVQAAFEVIAERIGAIFRVLGAIITKIFELVKEVASLMFTAFKALFLDPLLRRFGPFITAIRAVFEGQGGFVGIIKKVINTVIALFVGFFNFMKNRIDELGSLFAALGSFDITAPFESAARIEGALKGLLSPGAIFADAGKEFAKAIEVDYVGVIAAAAKGAGSQLKQIIDDAMGEGFVDDVNLIINPLESIDRLIDKLKAKSNERKALAVLAEGMSEIAEAADEAADEIDDLLGKLQDLKDADDAAEPLRKALQGIVDEFNQLTMTANEFELHIALQEAAVAAEKAGVNVEEFQDKVRSLVADLQTLRRVRAVADDISNAFADAFTDVIFGAATAAEAAEAFAETVSRALVERLIVEPLVEFLATAITKFAAELLSLSAAQISAGAILETSAEVAAIELTAGGVAAGLAITVAADKAAITLAAATAAIAIVGRGAVFSGTAGVVTSYRRGGLDRGTSATIAAAGLSATASGIVSQPMLIPQALLGEGAHPEGVFPLDSLTGGGLGLRAQVRTSAGLETQLLPVTRLADGNLGVTFDASSGSVRRLQFGGILRGNEGFTLPTGPIKGGVGEDGEGVEFGRAVSIDRRVTVNQSIITPNPDGFRDGRGQIIARLRRGARRGARNI